MKIVVVEDSEPIRRQLVALLLALPGAMVVGQASAEGPAIALLRQLQPDVVLLDLWLSPGHGLNVLKQMRLEGSLCRAYVITHLPADPYRQLCLEAGADDFFDKTRLDIDLLPRLQQEAWLDTGPWRFPDLAVPCPTPLVTASLSTTSGARS